ncbi:hypothetical protein PHYBLDRAFT_146779 [Phycomyces blakesleeanus NRRL 1555(-)]|uniref:Uncharacterized protein n=1 Tax=Phycomyces blakesleeanus (strain ATCC 8743b / DSM 1359 / FGSC 10004 / NBRC 33097 / NRRL 1555) TaxID=763407 RepID=A0A163ACS5_PHYB8|nr:hypothetical protein PHYBLDRAFT_146779 [Phycomyces blakesleeanus NRRL 1555(-)]OAD72591.1 hypothetical protein PHYBLDRAFT_146779 [Phycomyces blakesleeanus NRRL 1555(-)]|eukprot:XP_018290631.1 hypothetical protein PHYBLDRAFT_146779 [Phycomyces blakesleeanus NRRL 1555(-)]
MNLHTRVFRVISPVPASDVHDMEMGSTSICNGRTFCTLDNLASPISLSTVEPTSLHTAETTMREVPSGILVMYEKK